MKFLQILGYATLALALPSPASVDSSVSVDLVAREDNLANLDKRATITSALGSIVDNLQSAVTNDVAAVQSAATTVKGSTDIAVILKAAAVINTNYQAILSAVQGATTGILAGTLGAAGGLAGSVANLAAGEITQIITDLQTILTLIQNIRAVITLTATNLGPILIATVKTEILLVEKSIQPLVLPLIPLIAAVGNAGVTAGADVTGLDAVSSGLVTIGQQFAAGLI